MTQIKRDTFSPYSHGLEKHYAVETIDLKTLKPFTKKISERQTITKHLSSLPNKNEAQLHFRFGPRFDGTLCTLKLYEPIDSLALSPLTKQAIKGARIENLHELMTKKNELSKGKGITKGQLDEIDEKFNMYLGPNPLEPIKEYDLKSLLTLFLADLPPLLRLLASKRYRLQHLFAYASSDLLEVERLAATTKDELVSKTKKIISQKWEKLRPIIQSMAESCFYPFLERRLGIAQNWELLECFYNRCLGGYNQENQSIIALLQDLLEMSFLFNNSLHQIAMNAYAISSYKAKDFQFVINRIKEYFYNPQMAYPLATITKYLEHDCIKQWVALEQGFVEKSIALCNEFTLVREKQILVVVSGSAFHVDNLLSKDV